MHLVFKEISALSPSGLSCSSLSSFIACSAQIIILSLVFAVSPASWSLTPIQVTFSIRRKI